MSIGFVSKSRHPLIFIPAVLFLLLVFLSSCGVQNQNGLQSDEKNELSSEKASAADTPTALESDNKAGEEATAEKESPSAELSETAKPLQESPSEPPEVKSEPVSHSGSAEEKQSSSDPANKFTLSDVASHSTYESCWTVINNEVYDLTEWISKHPGGASNILKLCGIDGTTAFMQKHGSSARPKSVLAGYRIGELSS